MKIAKDDAALRSKSQSGGAQCLYALQAASGRLSIYRPPASGDARWANSCPRACAPRKTRHPFSCCYESASDLSAIDQSTDARLSLAVGIRRGAFSLPGVLFHTLNDKLPLSPAIGAEFQVPNVIPFEIENAFDEPLQPQADPKKPVTAAGDCPLAVEYLPRRRSGCGFSNVSRPSRPHDRDAWTILNASPRPRLATFQKERTEQTPKASPLNSNAFPESTPTPKPVLRLGTILGRRSPGKSRGNLMDQPGQSQDHRTLGLWSERNKHSRSNELRAEHWRVPVDQLGHRPCGALFAIRDAVRVEIVHGFLIWL